MSTTPDSPQPAPRARRYSAYPGSAARSHRLAVFGLLATAVILGGFLRLFHLGRLELTPDEAASWTAAAAQTLPGVVRRQAELNPGKLAAYDLVMHVWIAAFGGGLIAMRTLSAMLGTAAIVLIFWITREILSLEADTKQGANSIGQTAAISALIFAVSLVMIKYAREMRMYAALTALTLAQIGFLLRSRRSERFGDYAALSIFTALAIATNFTALFVFASEGLWLLSRTERQEGGCWKAIAAIGAAPVALLIAAGGEIKSSLTALHLGALNWIQPPSPWEPLSFFNRGTGTLPFPVLLALAIWGVASGWAQMKRAVMFALFWLWGPVLLLYVLSWTLTPILVERYALSSFIPFFILAAIGISQCGSVRVQGLALVIAVGFSVAHVIGFLRKPTSTQWQQAVEHVKAYMPAGVIAVAPPHGANVIRYYMPGQSQYVVTGLTNDSSCRRATILILWDHADTGQSAKQVRACRAAFSHQLYRHDDLIVLAPAPAAPGEATQR